jgi:CRP-like cAMP-binding protein
MEVHDDVVDIRSLLTIAVRTRGQEADLCRLLSPRLAFLRSIGSDATRSTVCAAFRYEALGAGSLIFNEGDRGFELGVVFSGSVALSVTVDATDCQVAEIGPGELFGEPPTDVALVSTRTATAATVERSELLWLDPSVLAFIGEGQVRFNLLSIVSIAIIFTLTTGCG